MSSPFPASREDFIETVMQIVTARFPLVKISRGAREFSVHVNGHVASLENLYLGIKRRGNLERRNAPSLEVDVEKVVQAVRCYGKLTAAVNSDHA